jgi:hypothetical protein
MRAKIGLGDMPRVLLAATCAGLAASKQASMPMPQTRLRLSDANNALCAYNLEVDYQVSISIFVAPFVDLGRRPETAQP